MTNQKELSVEELKKVSGGDSEMRTFACPRCGVNNEVEYSPIAMAILRGTCKNCGLDYRGQINFYGV